MRYKVNIAIISISFLLACKKPSQPTPSNTLPTGVYTAGVVYNVSSTTNACYWQNEKAVVLGVSGVPSIASDIAVVNNDIYVIGRSGQAGTSIERAALWKNGVLKFLTTRAGSARSITVNNGIVYVVGEALAANSIDNNAFVWNSATDALVELSSLGSMAYSIKYQAGEQLVSGHINFQATLWKNGIPSIINDQNFTLSYNTGTAAVGGTYYRMGARKANASEASSWQRGFWKELNGTLTFTNFSDYGIYSADDRAVIKGDTLVLVGRTITGDFKTALTKINTTNNNHTTISLLNRNSVPIDLAVDGDDIYILFYESINNSLMPKYWKNGNITTLESPAGFTHAEPSGIFIHKN